MSLILGLTIRKFYDVYSRLARASFKMQSTSLVLSVLLRLPRLDQVCVQSFAIWEARNGGAHFVRFRRLVSLVLMALVSHPLETLVLPVLRGTTSFSIYWFQLSCCRSWRQCRFMMPAVGHIGVMAHLCRPCGCFQLSLWLNSMLTSFSKWTSIV